MSRSNSLFINTHLLLRYIVSASIFMQHFFWNQYVTLPTCKSKTSQFRTLERLHARLSSLKPRAMWSLHWAIPPVLLVLRRTEENWFRAIRHRLQNLMFDSLILCSTWNISWILHELPSPPHTHCCLCSLEHSQNPQSVFHFMNKQECSNKLNDLIWALISR